MNFVCDHCKQKYHVADEKLRGRAVTRFKCKKCEHIIELQTGSLGAAAEPSSPGMPLDPTPHNIPAPSAPAAGPPGAGAAPRPAPRPRSPTATGPALSSVSPLTRAAAGPLGTGTGTGTGTGAGAARPAPARPRAPTTTGPAFSPATARSTQGAALSSVARAADKAPAPKPVPETPSTSSILNASETGWYAGIRDLPVGPLTRTELSARVQSGDVTADTLVWREGLDDWRPMRAVAELGDLLRLGAQRMSGDLLDELGKRPAEKPRGAQVVPIASARAASLRPPMAETADDEATKVTGMDPRIMAAVRDADAQRARPGDAFDLETRPISAFGEPVKTPSRPPPPPAAPAPTPAHIAPHAPTVSHPTGRTAASPTPSVTPAGGTAPRVVPQTLAVTPGALAAQPSARASVPSVAAAPMPSPAAPMPEVPSVLGAVPAVGTPSAPEDAFSLPPSPLSASLPAGLESQPVPLVVPSNPASMPAPSKPSGWSLAPPGSPTTSLPPTAPVAAQGLPKSVLLLLAGVLVVGLAGGMVLGPRLNGSQTRAAPPQAPPVAALPSPVVAPPITLPSTPLPPSAPAAVQAVAPPSEPVQGENTNSDHGHRDHRPNGREPTAPQVSAADLALIRAAGGTPTPAGETGPRDTALRTQRPPAGTTPSAPSSGAGRASSLARSLEQSRVVSRCWQNLLRLNPAAGARPVRITVSLSVNGSGRVSSVSVSNAPSPQFATCVESGARNLPPLGAGEALTTEVPVNLSAGATN